MKVIGKKFGLALTAAALPVFLLAPIPAQARGWHGHSNFRLADRYQSHYRGHHYHRGSDGLAVGILGVGIGLLIGSAMANQQATRERVVVRESTPAGGWVNPDYPPVNTAQNGGWYQQTAQAPVEEASTCLQTREYQTKITVGGKEVDAYGTACLQPDGDWQFGAPTPEPQ